jgi:predicted CoA-binding protein
MPASVIEKILKMRAVAVVGISADPSRPSSIVASYLSSHGYEIIPINPALISTGWNGKKSYATLTDAAEENRIEIVDVFRKSESVLPIVQEAISIGAKAVWMQEGVINEEAAALARKHGLLIIMNKCMKKEHEKL